MLELRTYTQTEIATILHTQSNQNIRRKLNRYGVEYSVSGRGEAATFEIKQIADKFKLFCILDLGMDANTDFNKFLFFLFYFLNDVDFQWLPDETLQERMKEKGKPVSRQTISKYKKHLEDLELFTTNTNNYVYYFARKNTQTITTKETYCQAWREHWVLIFTEGLTTREAITIMCANYGGVARKQPIPEFNGIYTDKINEINDLVLETILSKLN